MAQQVDRTQPVPIARPIHSYWLSFLVEAGHSKHLIDRAYSYILPIDIAVAMNNYVYVQA